MADPNGEFGKYLRSQIMLWGEGGPSSSGIDWLFQSNLSGGVFERGGGGGFSWGGLSGAALTMYFKRASAEEQAQILGAFYGSGRWAYISNLVAEEPKPTTKMVTGDADPALDLSMIDYSNYGPIYGVAAPLLLPAIEKTIEGVTITIAPEVAPVIVAGAAIYAGLYFADKYIPDIACQPSYGAPCSTLVNGVPVVYMEQQAKLIQEAFAFSKGGKQNLWDDQLSPLTLEELMEVKRRAIADNDTQLKRRVDKEEKRRGLRSAQKRSN